MTDRFHELRVVADAAIPDPDGTFAAELRAQLERVLSLPKGVVPVSDDPPRSAAVPYLAVRDARTALDWYREVFGAEMLGEPIEMPDGRIGHAELAVVGGIFYLADEHPEIGVVAPRRGEASVSLMLPVDDADAVRQRALMAGATGDRQPYDGYGRRHAWIVDPFGHRWGLTSPIRQPAGPGYRRGDIGYVSLSVADVERAAAFYRSVLGWEAVVDERRALVRGVTPVVGVTPSDEPPTLFCCFAVDELDDALDAVVRAGGRVTATTPRPEGRTADCVDDQGVAFAVYEPIDRSGPRPPANGSRPGELSYLTLEVVDSARARAFYGAVLGWRFTPGRIEDGWQVTDTTPMVGLRGGHDRATAIPMWRVADIDAAVRAVRDAGGTAADPIDEPYGRTATCIDDQGSRFYLGEL